MLGHEKIFSVFMFLKLKEANVDNKKFIEYISNNIYFYKWIYPLAMAVASTWLMLKFNSKEVFFIEDGIINHVNSLLGPLIGFYIASLAAVATFSAPSLNDRIAGRGIAIYRKKKAGEIEKIVLVRRQLLTAIFGYCTALSIVIFVGSSVASIFRDQLKAVLMKVEFHEVLTSVFMFFYFFLLSSLFVVTFLGLEYLVERLHRNRLDS